MLTRLDPRVDFHPLRLGGLRGSYRGHDGVRDWFLQTTRQVGGYQIGLSEVRCVGEREVFAVGSLHLPRERQVGSFAALHRIDRERIVAVYHCLTDPEMIEYLGLIP